MINEPKAYQQPLETQSKQDRPVCASNLNARGTIGRVYVQFIADERQWGYEPDARNEAKDFGD